MNRKTAGFIGLGFLVFLLVAGCEESTLENDTDGGSESIFTIFRTEHGLSNDMVVDICVDYIGDGVWFATRKGVSFYSYTDSTIYIIDAGVPSVKETAIAIDNSGTIWLGTESGVAYMTLSDSLWIPLSDMDNLIHRFVTDITPMTDFSIWFGTRGGVSVLNPSGDWKSYTSELGPSIEVTSISVNSHGDIWVGTTNGISVFNNTEWTWYGSSVFPNTYINVIYRDISGKMWCGTAGIAVAYDGTSWTSYGPADGLTANGINDFSQDHSGTLWAATDGGVFYFISGKWYSLNLPPEITGSVVTSIEADKQRGIVWIGTLNGVIMYTYSSGVK